MQNIDHAMFVASKAEVGGTYIIGGAEIYRLAAPYVTDLCITKVCHLNQGAEAGDSVFFPADAYGGDWVKVSSYLLQQAERSTSPQQYVLRLRRRNWADIEGGVYDAKSFKPFAEIWDELKGL
jgi:dihydrofolate reductase